MFFVQIKGNPCSFITTGFIGMSATNLKTRISKAFPTKSVKTSSMRNTLQSNCLQLSKG